MERFTLHHADCRDVLRDMPDNSIDSVVTDPPYALVSIVKRFGKPGSAPAKGNEAYQRASAGFMGKSWDTGEVAFSDEFWAEVLRVLKPGGHVVAFSGTRTYHRMAVAIEDAGFEIRDQLGWLYGSGFPKSHNQSGEWEGWGTALKPAWEPICFARKPLNGTVACNLAQHGTGAINIDGCRVEGRAAEYGNPTQAEGWRLNKRPIEWSPSDIGRWPANIIHDGSDEVIAAFPDAPGQQGDLNGQSKDRKSKGIFGDMPAAREAIARIDDTKSAARFFYCAKASRKDRDEGLDGFQKRLPDDTMSMNSHNLTGGIDGHGREYKISPRANTHPTVKPTSLMQWLCRLVTPPGGVILDPFMGSGSTGKAAMLEGFRFIGIEREAEYMPIAKARIKSAFDPDEPADPVTVVVANTKTPNQFDLFAEAAE